MALRTRSAPSFTSSLTGASRRFRWCNQIFDSGRCRFVGRGRSRMECVVYRRFRRRSADLSGVPPGGRLRFQRSRSRSCSSSPSLVRMVRASRSPLVRSANANRKSTAANEAVSIVKRGKRGYHTNGALFGRGMSRSIGPRGVWTGLAPSGRLSTPLTHMAGFIFWALTGRSEKDTARSARGSASRRDGPKSFFRCIQRS